MHTKRRPNNMGGNGGGQHRHNNNRPRRFNNNRPQNGSEGGGGDAASIARTRRNSIQSREKYQMMARDAMSMGDRVLAENYLQHADHFHRVLLSLPPEEAPRPQYLRGHGPEAEGASDQNSEAPQPVDNGNNTEAMEPSQALPSFITQPVSVAPSNPEDPQ